MIAPPGFWSRDGALPRLLSPAAALTARLTARRLARPGFDAGIPVLCAGNAGLGGAGKTILARHLLRRLEARALRPFALTRGHGGALTGPLRVDPARHRPDDVGDEALLLARDAPVILARDRAAGAALALREGANAIVMDDGLQNPGLAKTLSFLVIDGGAGFGNGRCLPAGPLREPIAAAAARCQAAILIGPDRTGARATLPPGLPVLDAALRPIPPLDLAHRRVIGFAGIGRPEKFFASLRALGADLVAAEPFPDHHRYTARDLSRLAAAAAAQDALLATTEKDAVKLPPAFLARCAVIAAALDFADPAALEALLP